MSHCPHQSSPTVNPPEPNEDVDRLTQFFACILRVPRENFLPGYDVLVKKKVFLARPNTYVYIYVYIYICIYMYIY